MFYKLHQILTAFSKIISRRIVAAPLMAAIIFFVIGNLLAMRNLYVIIDNGQMILHTTFEENAQVALEEAGITISKTDYVSLPQTSTQNRISEIIIQRTEYVTVIADNKETRLVSKGETVSQILEFADIKVRSTDNVVPDLGTPTSDGMQIVVTRFDSKLEYEQEFHDFEEKKIPNKKLPIGTERVSAEGSPGISEISYLVTFQDGKEISREQIRQRVIKKSSPRIIEYGTAGTVLIDGKLVTYRKAINVTCTAYTTEGSNDKITATGTVARVGAIAVDPRVIPLGSKVYIEGANGKWIYGIATCEDTGGVIKGNVIDLFFNTRNECLSFGRQKATLYVLNK